MDILQEPIGKWISVIHRKFQIDINKVLKPYDLNSSQYIFLVELYREDCVTQEYLVNKLHIDKSATARALKQLENNGYVMRSINLLDKRAYDIKLTEKAHAIHSELIDLLSDWNKYLTRNLTSEQHAMVHTLIKQMAEDLL